MQSALSYIYQNFPFFEYVEDLKKKLDISLSWMWMQAIEGLASP